MVPRDSEHHHALHSLPFPMECSVFRAQKEKWISKSDWWQKPSNCSSPCFFPVTTTWKQRLWWEWPRGSMHREGWTAKLRKSLNPWAGACTDCSAVWVSPAWSSRASGEDLSDFSPPHLRVFLLLFFMLFSLVLYITASRPSIHRFVQNTPQCGPGCSPCFYSQSSKAIMHSLVNPL